MDSTRTTPRSNRLFGGLAASTTQNSYGTPRTPSATGKRVAMAQMMSSARRSTSFQPRASVAAATSFDRAPSNLSTVVNAEPSTPRSTNVFRAPAVTPQTMPPTSTGHAGSYSFSPSIPATTMKKNFPASASRTRATMTPQVNGRGMAKAAAKETEPFAMRIPTPEPELSGEKLAMMVPHDPNRIGSVYAEDFLGHLVPSEFDDLQRRQWFCILDLRRLKYAADDIFVKKSWKLNIMNFAKEYEKSRGMIMLRYGLYEFKTVRPTDQVLKTWRSTYGLPDPEEEQPQTNGSKPIFTQSSKRKADDELTKDTALSTSSPNKTKRRLVERDEPVVENSVQSPTKRRRDPEDEQNENTPSKSQKTAAPSATRSAFEKVINNAQNATSAPTVSITKSVGRPIAKPKSVSGILSRSILDNPKAAAQSLAANHNPFAHLSDGGSANGSVNADADGESESDSDPDTETHEVNRSYEPSVVAGGRDTPSVMGANLFAPPKSGLNTGPSSTSSDGRETTPSRSLFDRVTKGADGRPVRLGGDEAPTAQAPPAAPEPAAPEQPSTSLPPAQPSEPANETWTPNTPIKFAGPLAAGGAVFGSAATNTSNPFGGLKAAAPATSAFGGFTSSEPAKDSAAKPVAASDLTKVTATDAPPTKRPMFGSSTEAVQTLAKPAFPTAAPSAPPAGPLLGAQPISNSTASTLFGAPKPAGGNAASGFKPTPTSTLPVFPPFNKTPSEPAKPAEPAEPKTPAPASGNIFAGAAKTPNAAANIFNNTPASFPNAPGQPASVLFSGATKSTSLFMPGTPAQAAGPGADGSPMKVEVARPAPMPIFGDAPAPNFNFGSAAAPSQAAPSQADTSFSQQPAEPIIFGAGGGGGTGSFTFTSSGVNNPFASQPSAVAAAPATSSFSFGSKASTSAAPSAPAPSGQFTFGGGSNGTAPAAPGLSGGSMFPFNAGTQPAPSTNAGATPSFFGGHQGAAPAISFTGASGAPAPTSNMFGPKATSTAASVFSNLGANAGGASTTGTNSPFNLGGASSLATTPITGTPEPVTAPAAIAAADDEAPQDQINLTNGGPGEEQEKAIFEVKAKVLKYVQPGSGSTDSESDRTPDGKSKNPWTVKGVGPLRILKHIRDGSVRLLVRTEPGGHVALNRRVLPDVNYDPKGMKYLKIATADDAGTGLETYMLQVKTKESAQALADVLEREKGANKV